MDRPEVKKREAILAAVMDLLSCQGPDGVTIPRVAESAGLSQGAVSHRYKNRSELFRATLDWILDRIDDRREEAWESARTARTKLEAVFLHQEKLLTEEPDLLRAWYAFVVLGRSDPWVAARVQEHYVDRIESIAGLVREAQAEAGRKINLAPGQTASDLISTLEGMGLIWLNRPDRKGIAAHRRRSVRRWNKILNLA